MAKSDTLEERSYKGSFAWNINEKDGALKKVLACSPKESMNSERFVVGDLPLLLEMYPKGDMDANEGCVMLYCTLIALPKDAKTVDMCIRLQMKETMSCFTSIVTLTQQGNSCGWDRETLRFDEVQQLKSLSIVCDVRIVKITSANGDVMHESRGSSPLKSSFNFSWRIDDAHTLAQFQQCRAGKSFESADIYDDMWCLRAYPNGKRQDDQGNCKLYLLLCSLPATDDLHIQYTLWCQELNVGYSGTIAMSYAHPNLRSVGWPSQIMRTATLQNTEHNALTFNAEIEIIPQKSAAAGTGDEDADDDDDDENESTYSSSSSLLLAMKGVVQDDAYEVVQTEDESETEHADAAEQAVSPPQISPADVATQSQSQSLAEEKKEPEQPQSTQAVNEEAKENTLQSPRGGTQKKRIHKKHKNKKKLSVEYFQSVDILDLLGSNIHKMDNYGVAETLCRFFDAQFDDTDTVCVVADHGQQPSISYWCKGQYVRKETNLLGKHILLYRACKHVAAKQAVAKADEFEAFVKKVCIAHEQDSVSSIADKLDQRFGDGCHVARSSATPRFDIFCRFSDKYECAFRLQSGAYIIAWRR